MTMTDPLGDMLTRIRNAQMRSKSKVATPASRLRGHVLDVLQEEGFIRGYAKVDGPFAWAVVVGEMGQLRRPTVCSNGSNRVPATHSNAPLRAQTQPANVFVAVGPWADDRLWFHST